MIGKLLEKYRRMPVAAKAAVWFMICSFLQKAMSIITTPIFTRMMTTEQYGQFTVYNSWLNIFSVITTLRLNYSVFNKGMSRYKQSRDEYVSTMQYITTAMTLLLLVVYLVFRRQVDALTELPTFITLAIFAELLVTPAISFWTLKKRYEYVYRDVVLRTVLMALMNMVLGLVAVTTQHQKGYARIMSCVVANLCFGVPLYLHNLRRGRFAFNREQARFALLFNLPLIAHFLSIYVLDSFDRIMIQKMVSFEAAALYGLTYQIGTLIKIVTTSLSNAMIPWMYDKLEKREFKPVDEMLLIATALVAVVSITVCIIAPEAIGFFAPAKYRDAIYVVPPVALGMIFQFLYIMYANIEFFFDMNKMTMFISSGAALLNVVLNYIGIKLFGFIAAAYTTLICYMLMSIGHYVYMRVGIQRKTGTHAPIEAARMMALTLASLVAGLSIVLLYPFAIARYCLVLATLAILFVMRKRIFQTFGHFRRGRAGQKD